VLGERHVNRDVARVGSYHAVEPGLGKPEYFTGRDDQADLGSLGAAMAAAKAWSIGGGRQEVTVTRGRVTTVIRVYEHGRDITTNDVLIPAGGPPAPDPDQVTVVEFAARRTRKPRKASINTPPCDMADEPAPA
jgi:hypothetical protein